MLCATTRRVPQLLISSLSIAGLPLLPVPVVRGLGILMNLAWSRLPMFGGPSRAPLPLCASCVIFNCSSSTTATRSLLVCSSMHSRLYCSNVVLVGLPANQQRSVKSVLGAAASLVFGLWHYVHVSDVLVILHWLRVSKVIDFKLAIRAFYALHCLGLSYLGSLSRVADLPCRSHICSSSSGQRQVPCFWPSNCGGQSFTVAASIPWNSLPEIAAILDFRQSATKDTPFLEFTIHVRHIHCTPLCTPR
jgi:hypothetical protein